MASPSHLLLLFGFFSFLVLGLGFNSVEYSVIFPVRKDPATLQYVARVSHGTPSTPTDLVVDLGAPSIWMACRRSSGGHVSSSYRLIPSCSANCSRAKSRISSNGEAAGCLPDTYCHVFPYNGLTGLTAKGQLVEDILAVDSVDRLNLGARISTTVDQFLYSCAPTSLLHGLASGAKGMLGLGKSSVSLPSQLTSSLGHPQKFSLCLSPSNGVVVTGNADPVFGTDITRSLLYTPLVTNQHHDDYFINVQSIKINGKRLAIHKSKLLGDIGEGKLGTKLSTNSPYTTMESSIFAVFSRAYVKAAANVMNMTRVEAVAPFDLCFSTSSSERVTESSMLDNNSVPEIELVLQSKMVKWRINGRNSMVKVSNEVMCLGVLDGGGMEQSSSSSIVIGGLQLEDNLLEFDVGRSMLGFSSSLLLKDTTCSSFSPHSKLLNNQFI